jgi:translocation and assembly module TamB
LNARKLAKRVGIGVLLLPVVALALVLGALASLRFRFVETRVLAATNGVLANVFEGRIVLQHATNATFRGARVDGEVWDPQGRRVAILRGVEAGFFWPELVWQLVRGSNPLVVDIGNVTIHDSVLRYIDVGDGSPSLAQAFVPKKSPTPATPGPPSETRVNIRHIGIDHSWIHGNAAGVVIDADVAGLEGDLAVDSKKWAVGLKRATVAARGLPEKADPAGKVSGTIEGQLEGDAPPDCRAHFNGRAAGVPLDTDVAFTGGNLEAHVDAPDVDPRLLERFVPGIALRDRARLSARIRGRPPALQFGVEVGAGDAVVRADGKYTGARVTGTVVASRVDLSRMLPGTPKTELGATVDVDATFPQGGLDGTYDAKVHGARVDGELVPNVDVDGRATVKGTTWSARGSADVAESGAPTHVLYDASGNARGTEIVLDAQARLSKPRRLMTLAGVETSGTVHAMLRLRPEKKEMTAKVEARLGQTSVSGISAGNVEADVAASGSMTNPVVKGTVRARPLQLPGRVFERAMVRADGTLDHAQVEAELMGKTAQIRAYGAVVNGKTLAILEPSVTFVDKNGIVRVSTSRVSVTGKRVDVTDLVLTGAGSAKGTLVYDGDLRRADVETDDLDVPRLLRIAEIRAPITQGKLSIVGSYATDRDGVNALVRGKARSLSFDAVKDGEVSVDLTLSHHVLAGSLKADVGRGASAVLSLRDITFDGSPTHPDLESVRGIATIEGNFDLSGLHPFLSIPAVPLEDAKGTVDAAVTIERGNIAVLPRVTAHVHTHGLELVGKRPAKAKIETAQEAVDATAWTLGDVDLDLYADGGGPESTLTVQGSLLDDKVAVTKEPSNKAAATKQPATNELANIEAFVELPKGAVTIDEFTRRIREAKAGVVVRMSPRRLRQLPEVVRPQAASGTLSFVLEADGTLDNPHVNLFGEVGRFGASGQRAIDEESVRVDVAFRGDYRKSGGLAEVDVKYKDKAQGSLLAKWSGDAVRLADKESGPSPITGDVSLKLDSFPVDVIPQAKNRQIGGIVSADIAVTDIGKQAEVHGRIEAAPLVLGQLTLTKVGASVDTKDQQVDAKAWAEGDGSLSATLKTKVIWKDTLLPALDPNLEGHVSTKRFQMSAATPFLGGVVSEVDGRLDAELNAKLENGVPKLAGHAEFDSGSLAIPAIGQEMSDIKGKVTLTPQQAVLSDFHARGDTGALSASATVDFAERFQLAGAKAEVSIKQDEKLPVTLEGVTIGDAWGKVEATFKKNANTNESQITVSAPDLHIDLPDTGSADAQALDSDTHVRVGAVRKDGAFVIIPTQPLESSPDTGEVHPSTSIIEVKLGHITVARGEEVNIELTGDLKAKVTDRTELTGQILTTGGTLDVTGKRFEVERGTITFTGENPPNPTIVAVARWDSPLGYRVYAEYTGTAKKAKLTLRSDPPLSTDQVLSLLMFGTPDGQFGNSSGSTASSAVGLAGGTAAKGINRAISDLTDLDVQARVDTSNGDARPEVVIQISPRVAARVTRAIGEPLPGTIPDRTFLTLEFRLQRSWILSALVGDRGATALDLLWRIRY